MTDQSFGIIPFRTTQQSIEFLLIRQQAGHWGFPKGHAKQNETPVEASLRECKEETGLTSIEIETGKIFREKYIFTVDTKNRAHYPSAREGIRVSKIVSYFLGRVLKGRVRVQKKEIQDYIWVSYEEALRLLAFPEVRKVLKRANQYALEFTKQKKNLHP